MKWHKVAQIQAHRFKNDSQVLAKVSHNGKSENSRENELEVPAFYSVARKAQITPKKRGFHYLNKKGIHAVFTSI